MSKPGTPALRGSALVKAEAEAAYMLRQMGVHKDGAIIAVLVRVIVKTYVKAAKEVVPARQRAGPLATAIAALKPGEWADFPEAAPQLFRNYFTTARKLLEEPDAAWLRRPQKGTGLVRITRLAPGERPAPDPRNNPAAVFLAAMNVGTAQTTQIFPTRQHMGSNVKTMARRILNDPAADWRARTTTKGIQVTRLK